MPGVHFEIYADVSGNWRWRLIGGDGSVMAVSGESYASMEAAKKSAGELPGRSAGAPVVREPA